MIFRALLLLILWAGTAVAQVVAVDLQDLTWRAGLLGRGLSGRAVLVSVPAEGWRAEAAGAFLAIEDLMAATGDGWTLVGAPDGRVWGAPWGDPLKELEAPLASTLTASVAALTPLAATPKTLVLPARGEPLHPGLLRRLAARAEGRGGPFETITLRTNLVHSSVRLASRRRHGGLVVTRLGLQRMTADPADLLLPAWSLADVLARP